MTNMDVPVPITDISQIKDADGNAITKEAMLERLSDWYCKPAGYEREFKPAGNDPRMRKEDFPLECFTHRTMPAEKARRIWTNEFTDTRRMLNIPKIVGQLLRSTTLRETETLDWKHKMPEVLNLMKKLFDNYREGQLKEA